MKEELIAGWKREEELAHMRGWDFSHIDGRYRDFPLPWDYAEIVKGLLRPDMRLLDFDTGGGELLLSFGHPCAMTAATEGWPPNVALCRETLSPLGIDFRECADARAIPFEDGRFDMVVNSHGSMDENEFFRLLAPGGIFVTEQVGSDNDRELVELLLPGAEKPFPDENPAVQVPRFEKAGFELLRTEEAFRPMEFYDVGAIVWFARVVEWEFPGFSVEACLPGLMEAQRLIETEGKVSTLAHRYLIVARKPARAGRDQAV